MRAIGIILAGGNNNKMKELSNKRAIAAMPVSAVSTLRLVICRTPVFRK